MTSEPLSSEFDDWKPDQIAAVMAPVGAVIEAQRLRIEYAETRRAALGVLSGVILAAGLAGLVQLAGADVSYKPALVGLVALCASLVAAGVTALVIYGRQTTWPYPFKQAQAETWKWFYRDAIPQAYQVIPPWHGRQSQAFIDRSNEMFAETRVAYTQRMLGLADPQTNLAQDLEQAHLLSWNEFYKNRFLEQLRRWLIRGVLGSVGVGGAAFLVALAIEACN